MVLIIDAVPDHIKIIQQLAEKIWWPTYSPILEKGQLEYMLQTIYSEQTMLKKMSEGSETFLILEEDRVPKAFASFSLWPDQLYTWKINKLYVLPECHGKGFGKALIDEISARAGHSGISSLVLNVNKNNPALSFYKKYGFEILREEDIPIGPYWMNDYVMKISLAESS